VQRVEVVEYTDAICSWAWGSEPKLRLLRWRYEGRCDWRLVMGGLVGDRTKTPGWDPVAHIPHPLGY
ncbi:MAG TPA: DsbA family protein, partial [Candidatus Saccharimonadia bacterium]|nr:DsbA family protein [Candidatus Saccharimonadia bacterium]